MTIRIVKGSGRLVEDGTYAAVVKGLNERGKGKWKHYFIFHFMLAGGIRLTGLVPARFDEDTDLDRWLTAILGRTVEDGEELELKKAVVGRRCKVKTETVTKGKGRRYCNVIDVLPPKAKGRTS